MIKAIIFDNFGVVITDGFDEAYRRAGGDPDKDQAFLREVMYQSDSGQIATSIPVIAKKLGLSDDAWRDIVNDGRVINYDLLKYVAELRERYETAMLSNVGSAGVRRFYPEGLLERYFDPIVESGVIGFAKPEASAYMITADKLGVRCDECVMIDDRPDYVEGAIAVGMQAILYKNLDQLKEDIIKILE